MDGGIRLSGVGRRVVTVVIGLVVFLGETSRGLFAPLTQLEVSPVSLDPKHLPEYAARTTFRMFAALALSLVFTLTYATWAISRAAVPERASSTWVMSPASAGIVAP